MKIQPSGSDDKMYGVIAPGNCRMTRGSEGGGLACGGIPGTQRRRWPDYGAQAGLKIGIDNSAVGRNPAVGPPTEDERLMRDWLWMRSRHHRHAVFVWMTDLYDLWFVVS